MRYGSLILILIGLLTASAFGQNRSLAILPLNLGSGVSSPEKFNASTEATGALYSALQKASGVMVYRARANHPSLSRAVAEGRLRRERLDPPYTGREVDGTWVGVRLGRELSADYVIVGTVEEFSSADGGKSARVTLNIDLLEVKTNRLVLSSAESGVGRISDDQPVGNQAYISALNDAASKIKAGVLEAVGVTEQSPEAQKRNKRQGELGVAALFGVSFLIGLRLLTQR
ncbi:MAG: hypothetical protein HUU60_05420 [Armatimonadetes bacterium]|nr:hypothetical protein [Armatimonadota bacterium]